MIDFNSVVAPPPSVTLDVIVAYAPGTAVTIMDKSPARIQGVIVRANHSILYNVGYWHAGEWKETYLLPEDVQSETTQNYKIGFQTSEKGKNRRDPLLLEDQAADQGCQTPGRIQDRFP